MMILVGMPLVVGEALRRAQDLTSIYHVACIIIIVIMVLHYFSIVCQQRSQGGQEKKMFQKVACQRFFLQRAKVTFPEIVVLAKSKAAVIAMKNHLDQEIFWIINCSSALLQQCKKLIMMIV